jgi:hypothetical protein
MGLFLDFFNTEFETSRSVRQQTGIMYKGNEPFPCHCQK